jgi:hypothetical protein
MLAGRTHWAWEERGGVGLSGVGKLLGRKHSAGEKWGGVGPCGRPSYSFLLCTIDKSETPTLLHATPAPTRLILPLKSPHENPTRESSIPTPTRPNAFPRSVTKTLPVRASVRPLVCKV